MKKFALYLGRWQLSSPILAACILLLPFSNDIVKTIIANFIGGCIFYFVDKQIFNGKEV